MKRDASSKRYNILLLEDSRADTISVGKMLKRIVSSAESLCPFNLTHISDINLLPTQGLGQFDVVLLDLLLPGCNGLFSLDHFNQETLKAPIIVLAEQDDEKTAIDAVSRGVQDYLVKGDLSEARLKNAIRYAVERHKNIQSLRELALLDGLTGLYNRKGFSFLTSQHMALAKRNQRKLLLFYMDLDGMKTINDTLGHDAGDGALIKTSQLLRQTFRDSDVISRLGGDEFVALALESKNYDKEVIVKRLQQNIEMGNKYGRDDFNLSISIGVAEYSSDNPVEIEPLLKQADRAMYTNKRRKKFSPNNFLKKTVSVTPVIDKIQQNFR